MNIVYMGTPEIAAVVLKALHDAGHHMIAAVTQQDKPKGRGNQVQYPPVKELALSLDIPVYQPRRVKEPEFIEVLKELNPEVIVVAAFGQILPKAVLEIPKYGCINVHASLLPKYRGAAPIQWSIIEGEEKTGITIMHMDEGLDTGDMISKAEVNIDPKETFGSLHDKLAEAAGPLLLQALSDIEAGKANRIKQKDEESSYAKILDKSIGHIDFNQPAEKIERLIRGLNPWPSAYTALEGKILKIWDADVISEAAYSEKAFPGEAVLPGEVREIEKDALLIQTGEGVLAVKELQLEGKKRMTAENFLRGYEVKVKTLLQ
ncbi:methionyl-tRNA formyltransferase [Anaerocolumna xylanovorans]|uniref:Methionyl-tRNA formyltransferase n=1 Tax=Anaerocolumna xylanovorans DSM 12503 TaxID=1121345 RepID=A0A1M7YBP1_9FIRM|nr:methionyl-tRNA formyltransferase [Anaerocolumna xylanovorans]SHO49989.1 methionyl-tRNA formyltransferase [Anaerocolumna xylanovorans DSM 12503]